MKTRIIKLAALCLAVMLLAGCSVRANINKGEPSVEELLANQKLVAEPVAYNADGAYTVTFRYDEGGFKKMDLSRAYVAYERLTVLDQIETIVGEDAEDIPPLPFDAQSALDEAVGEGELLKIAVITVETVDDKTVKVSFTDNDNPYIGKEYFFIIPNAGVSGAVTPQEG